jgi:hypothetical protein
MLEELRASLSNSMTRKMQQGAAVRQRSALQHHHCCRRARGAMTTAL